MHQIILAFLIKYKSSETTDVVFHTLLLSVTKTSKIIIVFIYRLSNWHTQCSTWVEMHSFKLVECQCKHIFGTGTHSLDLYDCL